MKYNRALMQAIMWDRINIAEIVGVQVISLDDAPRGNGGSWVLPNCGLLTQQLAQF